MVSLSLEALPLKSKFWSQISVSNGNTKHSHCHAHLIICMHSLQYRSLPFLFQKLLRFVFAGLEVWQLLPNLLFSLAERRPVEFVELSSLPLSGRTFSLTASRSAALQNAKSKTCCSRSNGACKSVNQLRPSILNRAADRGKEQIRGVSNRTN